MKTGLKIKEIKCGPVHELDNTWLGIDESQLKTVWDADNFNGELKDVACDLDDLAFGHLNFLLNGRDDDVADVSYDDIQHLKDKLTKIQHKYFK